MKKNLPALITVFTILASQLTAATISESISGESLVAAPPMERFSAGINYDQGKRGIKSGNSDLGAMEYRAYSAFLGYDLAGWCTAFVTIGRSQSIYPGRSDEYGDAEAKWSLGINGSLWHVTVDDPDLFIGRVSIKPVLEFTQYNSESDGEEIKWNDISGALFLSYDKVIQDPGYNITEFYGYSFYLGPAFSTIDGTRNKEIDFDATRGFGIIGGLDFFITSHLSLGGQLQVFDELSFGGSARYHF